MDMLRESFRYRPGAAERIGVEIEAGLVDPETCSATPYRGPGGVVDVLEAAQRRWCAKPVGDHELIGVRRGDGTQIGLESGCALEYVSTPEPDLVSLVEKVDRDMADLACLCDDCGVAVLSGSMLPYD